MDYIRSHANVLKGLLVFWPEMERVPVVLLKYSAVYRPLLKNIGLRVTLTRQSTREFPEAAADSDHQQLQT